MDPTQAPELRMLQPSFKPKAHHSRIILHLDDDATELLLMESLLQPWSETVVYYPDKTATAFFRTFDTLPHVDAILLDYNLNDPNTNGFDVLKTVRDLGFDQTVTMLSSSRDIVRQPYFKKYQARYLHKDDLTNQQLSEHLMLPAYG